MRKGSASQEIFAFLREIFTARFFASKKDKKQATKSGLSVNSDIMPLNLFIILALENGKNFLPLWKAWYYFLIFQCFI